MVLKNIDTHIVFQQGNLSAHMYNILLYNLKKMNIKAVIDLSADLVNEILKKKRIIVNVKPKYLISEDMYEHSIRVAVLAVVIGIGYGFSFQSLKHLASSALLHDIGKTVIDQNILNKNGKLTDDEYAVVQQHSLLGYKILSCYPEITDSIKTAVLQHHENENGTGYPNHISSDRIHPYAKIIHVADVYDAILAARPYKSEQPPKTAVSYILSHETNLFDKTAGRLLNRYVYEYPCGSELLIKTDHTKKSIQ